MRDRTVVIAAVLVLLGLARQAGAQETLALRLTLGDAVARAIDASHRLAEARARQTAAEAGVAAREAAARPTLTASSGFTRTNHVLEFTVPSPTGTPRVLYPDVPNNYISRLELRWPIYTGGRTDALERAARAEADAVSAEVSAAQADLRLEVTRAYWAVVTAAATLRVLEQGIARSEAHVADVAERSRAGLVPPNELASATAQQARARMLAIEARNQLAVSAAELARLVGVDPAQAIQPTDDLATPIATLSQDAAVLHLSARDTRPERRALQHRLAAAAEQQAAAAAARRPAISVTSGVDYARPNPRIFPREDRWQESWDAGVGVSWSLWDGGRAAAEVAQAAGAAEAARRRLAEFDSVLAVELRQRTLDIESGQAAIAAADSGVAASAEARRVVEERYRAGVISQIEVLDAEFALLQAELDRTRARAAVRLAEARLARALGQ